jgi:hypothetical protein
MKKTNSTIQKKLKAYSAVAGTFIAATGAADAQVMYTDVMPDSTISNGGIYMLDLNNDDIADFKLMQTSGTLYGFSFDAIAAYALAANNAIDTMPGGGASALDIGVSVDASLNWVDSTAAANITPVPTANGLAFAISALAYYGGNFSGVVGKFLPLRFENLGSTYYGWVRLDVPIDALSFTVIDYAYTDDPDHSTITGDMVGISEAAIQNQINIFVSNNAVTVELGASKAIEGTIEILNISGQLISRSSVTNASTVITLENAKTGIYLVTVKQAHSSYTKRIFVK